MQWRGLIGLVCLLAACLASCSTPPPPFTGATQVAGRMGSARSPVLSRDGATVAFAADADGYANPQIWVSRADGTGPPRPLTNDTAQNYDPEFSQDGRSIYFTSTREPRGIYRVPVFGGAAELAIPGAYSMKLSPDGATVVYGKAGKVVQRPLAGGVETPLLPSIDNSLAPIWSPDGKRILLATTNPEQRGPEWWIVAATGGDSQKTSLGADLRSQGFNSIAANAWLAGDWIVFTGRQGETQTLWKIQLGPDGRTAGMAVRVTEDGQGDADASVAAGRMVFSRTRVDMNLWALSLDAAGEHVMAPPQSLTATPVRKGQQSAAGGKLLYSAENGDRFSLFLKDLVLKDPEHHGDAPDKNLRDGFFAALAPDGSRYAYGEGTKEHLNVYLKSLRWWSFWSSTLCGDCGMPRQFSPDGRSLLLWADSAPVQHLDMLDVTTHGINRIVSASALASPRLSPDGRWISFVAQTGSNQWQVFVVPASPERELLSSEWVPVTPASSFFLFAFWSARGDVMYTLSSRGEGGNLRYLDAQRLDPGTKRPVGASMPVYEFPPKLVPGMDPVWNTVSIDGARIILELGGLSSEIWIK